MRAVWAFQSPPTELGLPPITFQTIAAIWMPRRYARRHPETRKYALSVRLFERAVECRVH